MAAVQEDFTFANVLRRVYSFHLLFGTCRSENTAVPFAALRAATPGVAALILRPRNITKYRFYLCRVLLSYRGLCCGRCLLTCCLFWPAVVSWPFVRRPYWWRKKRRKKKVTRVKKEKEEKKRACALTYLVKKLFSGMLFSFSLTCTLLFQPICLGPVYLCGGHATMG